MYFVHIFFIFAGSNQKVMKNEPETDLYKRLEFSFDIEVDPKEKKYFEAISLLNMLGSICSELVEMNVIHNIEADKIISIVDISPVLEKFMKEFKPNER